MVFVKPTDVGFVEMISNRDDSFAFELGWLPGMYEFASSIGALLSLACEVSANFLRHNLRKDIGRVDRWILEINMPKSFLSLAAVSTFTPLLGFFCF